MKWITLFSFLLLTFTARAQEYRERIGFTLESIADINIGWISAYKAPVDPKPKTAGARSYSAKQIGYSQQFMEWMQMSYQPKGCLGSISYYQNYIPTFSATNSKLGNAINKHAAALPLLYGAYSRMYMFLKKDAQGKFVPQNNFAEFWHIEANQLQYISLPVSFISSADEYYFMVPDYTSAAGGYSADDKQASNLKDFTKHKNINEYIHFYIPPKLIGDAAQYVVIMTKNNKLPFDQVTIGEFFTMAEKQFPAWQEITPVSKENYAVALKNLNRLKEKYKTKLSDVAMLTRTATQITLNDFVYAAEGKNDFFDNKDIDGTQSGTTRLPLLKVNSKAHEACKTDQPQWIVIRWTMGMPNAAFNNHLHESILNNFNFGFVYNYFFNAANPTTQVYAPLKKPF